MQPYFFPYLGYWQLINAVDKYVASVEKCETCKLDDLLKLKVFANDLKIGLSAFKEGTEGGFEIFEKTEVLKKLEEFVKNKGVM